jgi:two-component system, cell cycle response regulator
MKKKNKRSGAVSLPVEFEMYERKLFDLKQLIEISKGLNSTLDYNVLIDSILLTCMGHMQLIKAGIFLRKELDEEHYILHKNYMGFDLDREIDYEIAAESDIISLLDNNDRCYTLEELSREVGDDTSLATINKINPTLVVPLKGKGKLNGIIVLAERINGQIFREDEKEYLLNIASLAGIAIQNAYLYEMATTDMMTKLKIHHFFQATLVDERDKAAKRKIPFCVIMMDIDNFKQFNDKYGHTCGDMLIINIAKIVIDNVRQMDIPARYGGDELAIILLNTEMKEALVVAERIRRNVEQSRVKCGDIELGATVSIGVTQFVRDTDRDNKTLIERADRALYLSKDAGRNKVSYLI